MNVKLHTPKSMKMGSGLSSAKQFFLSLLATTISIVLTFGTAGIIDHHKKVSAKKEMVMMVLNDFDKTIDVVQKADTSLLEVRRLQQELATHPEQFDSLRFKIAMGLGLIDEEFPETIENIFSTSIETFNTIGDVNFVNDVSSFYICRRKYKENLLNELKKEMEEKSFVLSLKDLLSVSFPEYVYLNKAFLEDMKQYRDRCMKMMKVSEKDMSKFSKQQDKEVNPEKEAVLSKAVEEFVTCDAVLEQAKEKLKD